MLIRNILGNNRRNLQYIKKLNPKKAIRLVDDKWETKYFLSKRGIPVPKTYALLKSRKAVLRFDFARCPERFFVVKPNRGSKGRGIHVVKRFNNFVGENQSWTNFLLGKFKKIFYPGAVFYPYGYQSGGIKISDIEFKKRLLYIIEGNFSLENRSDFVLVEEKLIPGPGFADFCQYGLADIRVIVANLVPVMAMLRMPTKASGGKANLAQGGVAFGIDVLSGKITSYYQHGKVFVKDFPHPYADFKGKIIPYRNDILLHSANAQYFVNMGFLGLDWVVTATGPKLLEMNAKSGMEIQNVNVKGLQKYLHKISDLDIQTPQKGIEVMKSIFSPKKVGGIDASQFVYLSQPGEVSYRYRGFNYKQDVIVEVNTKKKKNYVSSSLAKKLKDADSIVLYVGTQRLALSKFQYVVSTQLSGNRVELGMEILHPFYLKPAHQSHISSDIFAPGAVVDDELDDLQILDQKLYLIAKEVSLSRYLKPTNYLDQFDKFINKKGKYNPKFSYNFPSKEQFSSRYSALKLLIKEYITDRQFVSPFAKLFYDKIDELRIKISLLKAYKEQDSAGIAKYNNSLYGVFDMSLLKASEDKIASPLYYDDSLLGKKIYASDMVRLIKLELKKRGITGVWVGKKPYLPSKINVTLGKQPKIKIMDRAVFREYKLSGMIAHEIDTHLMRLLNGRKTGWHILASGTANYHADEEGLATLSQELVLQERVSDYDSMSKYKNYLLSYYAGKMNFVELCNYLMHLPQTKQSDRTLKAQFATVMKYKKGIKDTSVAAPAFIKNKVYLEGFKKISAIEDKGKIEKMIKFGKVKVEDLEMFV